MKIYHNHHNIGQYGNETNKNFAKKFSKICRSHQKSVILHTHQKVAGPIAQLVRAPDS